MATVATLGLSVGASCSGSSTLTTAAEDADMPRPPVLRVPVARRLGAIGASFSTLSDGTATVLVVALVVFFVAARPEVARRAVAILVFAVDSLETSGACSPLSAFALTGVSEGAAEAVATAAARFPRVARVGILVVAGSTVAMTDTGAGAGAGTGAGSTSSSELAVSS